MVATPGQPQNLPHWLLVKSGSEQQSAGTSAVSAQQPEKEQPVRTRAVKPPTPIYTTPASPYEDSRSQGAHASSSNEISGDPSGSDSKSDKTAETGSFAAMYGHMKRQKGTESEYSVAELRHRAVDESDTGTSTTGGAATAHTQGPVDRNFSDRVGVEQPSEQSQANNQAIRRTKLTSGDTFPQAKTILRGGPLGADSIPRSGSSSSRGSNYSVQPATSRHSEESQSRQERNGVNKPSRKTESDSNVTGNNGSGKVADGNAVRAESSGSRGTRGNPYASDAGFSGTFVGSDAQPVRNNIENIAQARESRIERRQREEREAARARSLNGVLGHHEEENMSESYRLDNDGENFSENIGSFPTSRGRTTRHSEATRTEQTSPQQSLAENQRNQSTGIDPQRPMYFSDRSNNSSGESFTPTSGAVSGTANGAASNNLANSSEPRPFVPPQTNQSSSSDSYRQDSGYGVDSNYGAGFNSQPQSTVPTSANPVFREVVQEPQPATTPTHHIPEAAGQPDSNHRQSVSGYAEQVPSLAEPTTAIQRPTPSADEYMAPPMALDQSILINPVRPTPKTGWRKLVHTLTAGYVNLGESEKTLRRERLVDSIRTPLRGDYRIAVLSLKGGVGKTTTSVMLGGVFATVRGDRVIAIDANPDLGTLAQRAALPGSPTIRDLLNANDVSRYSLIKNYTTQADSRLEVIGSDRDPEVSEAFSEKDYRHAIDILQHHYNIILTDCGTGLMHSAMSGVLDLANTLIIVTSTALDGAQSASATLDWLNHHGYEKLVSNAIVVISSSQPGTPSIDVDQLMEHFRARTRAAHLIPFDRHLSEGAMIDLDRLERKTFMAYLELAGLVAHDFPNWHKHANSHE